MTEAFPSTAGCVRARARALRGERADLLSVIAATAAEKNGFSRTRKPSLTRETEVGKRTQEVGGWVLPPPPGRTTHCEETSWQLFLAVGA